MKNASFLIHPSELSVKWIDRMADNRITTLALHPVGGKKANITLADMLDLLEKPEYRELLDYAADRGMNIEYEMHAARYLLPEEYFDTHPEWFRMNSNGERSRDLNCCASSDEALDLMADNAAMLVKKLYRSTSRYFLWLDDAKEAFCHCEKCREMSASDQQMRILNRILSRLKKDDPNATLAYLAYCETLSAPKTVAPENGIFLEYAPFLRDFHKPLREDAEFTPLSELLELFGKEDAKVLEYWYDNSLFSNWKKPPVNFKVDLPVMEDDIALYSELGFSDISSFACFLGEDYEALYGEVDISDFGRCMFGK